MLTVIWSVATERMDDATSVEASATLGEFEVRFAFGGFHSHDVAPKLDLLADDAPRGLLPMDAGQFYSEK